MSKETISALIILKDLVLKDVLKPNTENMKKKVDILNCQENIDIFDPLTTIKAFWKFHLEKISSLKGNVLCSYLKEKKITDEVIFCIHKWHEKTLIAKMDGGNA